MCVAVDDLVARGRYAVGVRGEVPTVEPSPAALALVDARHPLLLAAGGPVVAFDLTLGDGERTLLVSGPNTGGKTVLLKTVALAAALAQSGIVPPVGPGTSLPIFRRFFADIGDRQSIAASLSTFSAHVATLRAILDEANTFGLRVTAHLGLTDAVTAATLGVRSIEHMSGVPEAASTSPERFYAAHRRGFFPGWTYFESSWATLDSAALARVAKVLVEKNVILIPTLVLHETLSRLDDPALLHDPALKAVPDSEIARWNVPGMIARAGWTAADFSAFRAARPIQNLFLREFLAAGGVIAAGTDASNQMLVPGASEHTEMELLVAAGLSPADAILAATHDAATLLGADSIGVLTPGKAADLVVLSRNPLENIHNTRTIERVMVRGQLLAADSIRASW